MKMGKLFAGIAAAATLLSGMAIGVTAASAAPNTEATLTVNHAQAGHIYTACRIATFDNPQGDPSDPSKVTVEIKTVTSPDWVKALQDAFKDNKDIPLKDEYQNNPAAALANLSANHARRIIDKLVIPNGATGTELSTSAADGSKTATVGEGWYVVTNTFDGTSKEGTTALVATKITDGTKTYTKFTLDRENGQLTVEALGEFNAKHENGPNPPDKTVENVTTQVNDQTVNVGDTVRYTVKHTIPALAAGSNDYEYAIFDKADKGLTIHGDTVNVTVEDVATPLTRVTDQENHKDETNAYILDGPTVSATDGTIMTKVTLTYATAKAHAGKKVTVTYTATVNKDILDNADQEAKNEAKVYTKGGESGAGTTEANTHDFQFKKVGVGDTDKNGLAGAKFVVKKDNKYLKLNTTSKAWSLVDDQADAAVFTSGPDGMVKLEGLSSGKYTVVETEAPTSYAQNFKVTFDVTIMQDGIVSVEQDTLHLVTPDGNDTQIKNVKSVTQLPLTGAAGTVLFHRRGAAGGWRWRGCGGQESSPHVLNVCSARVSCKPAQSR